MREKCYIVIHQGIGDLFNSVGIINYYEEKYKNVFILLLNNLNLNIMRAIFHNRPNIVPNIPEFINYQQTTHPNTCVNCMTNGKPNNCRRKSRKQCIYINYDELDGDIIKIGSFNNACDWENYRKDKFSFAHSFYTYNNLDASFRIDKFNIYNDTEAEINVYNTFIKKYGKKYILIHEDDTRNLKINRTKINNKTLPIINLNKISDTFVDYTKIIKNASEIHLIDSSWSVFIYLLSYKDIKDKPIFLNESYFKLKGRDTNIYKNPTFSNWVFY
jgi:hypothetical protein